MIILPPKFTATQLKQIARLCGTSRSGTKAVILDRIIGSLQNFKPLTPGTRVLSIDLGIRNLAYSLLEVPSSTYGQNIDKSKGRRSQNIASMTPILHAWERLALIPKIAKPPKRKAKSKSKRNASAAQDIQSEAELSVTPTKSRTKKGKKSSQTQEDLNQDNGLLAVAEQDPTTIPVLVEDFSPTRLSAVAVDLVLSRLLPLKPDLVIMEQQRFRSMGGSTVLEWTLRVNSLESMLYAIFTTLKTLGQWPHGKLEGVVARNVLEFMAVQEGEGASIWSKEGTGDNKRIKKDIVGKMLSTETGVRMGKEKALEDVVREYVERWGAKGKRGKASTGGVEGMKKLDDLADCLLQGMAFIRWQENKDRLLEGGVEALQDQMINE